jgi:hypothetical protein
MLHIAHRGCIDRENTIQGILDAFLSFPIVEIDVRYNSERKIVLCHDREKRNEKHEYLIDLCKLKKPMHLLVDIKAFGIETAQQLARDLVECIKGYPQHTYELCSFNEYCVQELIYLRLCSQNYVMPYIYKVGVITSGLSIGIFGHIHTLDFVSFNYDTLHEEILDKIRNRKQKIYAWVCNDHVIKHDMEYRYKVDGIIYDYVMK